MHASRLRLISYSSLLRSNAATGKGVSNTRASEFLLETAEREEREQEQAVTNLNGGSLSSNSATTAKLTPEHPNWTGEESIQDAVLRMLVDKYKPLRGGSIRTAEEKIRENLKPNLHLTTTLENTTAADLTAQETSNPPAKPLSSSSSSASTSSSENHKPWLVTFRPPSHAASIKYMRLPPPLPARSSAKDPSMPNPDDTRSKMVERDKKRKAMLAGRLTNAREATLDYRLGKNQAGGQTNRPNPVSLKGWNRLIEERIERARNEGLFRNIKGRGKPLMRDHEQTNPFIPREEFLMNRIVQRQGAAPPWVEFQKELESAITAFRDVLKSTWTRRAIRILTTTNHPAFFSSITLAEIARLRDTEWEAREQAYHDKSLAEINSLVRKYNGVAPYTVRRTALDRRVELERIYEECKDEILEEVRRRAGNFGDGKIQERGVREDEDDRGGGGADLQQSGRMAPSKSMFNWRAMWSKLISLVGG